MSAAPGPVFMGVSVNASRSINHANQVTPTSQPRSLDPISARRYRKARRRRRAVPPMLTFDADRHSPSL